MPCQVKLIFQVTTRTNADSPVARTGSWTESFWHTSNDLGVVAAAVQAPGGDASASVISKRCRLLPEAAAIVAFRLQGYDFPNFVPLPVGPSFPKRLRAPGAFEGDQDIPQMGCQLSMAFVNQPVRTQYVLRCLPDALVRGGELDFGDTNYGTRIQEYTRALAANFGSIIILRVGNDPSRIRRVTADGTLHGLTPVRGFAAGQKADVRHSRDACGKRRGGIFIVDAVNADGTIKLRGWPPEYGQTTGGSVIAYARDWVAYDANRSRYVRAVPRKIGLPFDRYRGKQKRRLR